MAFDVHIHIAFECWSQARLERLARQHVKLLQADEARKDAPPEAELFLEYVASGHSVTGSRKGALCTWGCVANYTSAGTFIYALTPFWHDLYKEAHDDTGDMEAVVADFCRIIIFQENEQSGAASAVQISLDKRTGELELNEFHDLPFSWGQA